MAGAVFYLYYSVSVLFGDAEMAKAILATDVPLQQKRYGRKVQRYDDKVWNEKCRDIVAEGSYMKVSQPT